MAGRETRRREQRKKEERERARAEERAEQRREEERERRREEEREAEREEERRAEALQRAREFEATEQRARERQERYRERLRAERHAEAQAAARSSERRETSQSERREESRSERREEARSVRREEEQTAARRQEREDQRREQERESERDAARREQARAAERESERRRLQTAAERDRRREQAQAEDRERDRREASREEGRRERLGQSEQQRREEERREEQRAVAQDARRQEARANEERRNGEAQRRDEARRTRADERRSADRQQARSQARTADAAAERRTERRRLTRQRLPTGERSGSLAWLRTSRRFVVDEAGDAEELALLADWGATAVLVPIAQNLVLDGVETADADDYLDALDRTIETAAEAGVYTVVQLSLLNSRLPTHSREGSSAFDPQVPDPRSIDLWSLLAQRYRSEPAVLFDLFRAPHEPDPESADALEPVPWEVWRRYLLAMIGEIRRAHPRALVFARGLARGSDLSGFPLRYSDGTFVPNVVYGAEVGDEDPTVAFRALAPLARTHPVGVLAVRTGPLDVPAVELLGEVLARAGYHWFADGWREPGAELVVRSRLRTTPLGNAFAGALARPPAPEANLDRTSNGGGGGGGVAGAFRLLARMLPGAIPPGAPTPAPAAKRANYVFYGFSGAQPLPSFPDGRDTDQSFALVARTLEMTLKKLFPGDDVHVIQAWTKEKILDALEHATAPIRDVHIAAHGAATWISLAYHFNPRLVARILRVNALAMSEHERALETMRSEDAMIAGFFTNAIDPARLAAIRANHGPGASWQIWGCYAGESPTRFGDPSLPPPLFEYFQRLNLGLAQVDGVAAEIAKRLGVVCTAARDRPGQPERGLEFWHGTRARTVEKNTTTTPAQMPFWLWNVPGSEWVSYDSSGGALPNPQFLGTARTPAELLAGKPPRWLSDLFWRT